MKKKRNRDKNRELIKIKTTIDKHKYPNQLVNKMPGIIREVMAIEPRITKIINKGTLNSIREVMVDKINNRFKETHIIKHHNPIEETSKHNLEFRKVIITGMGTDLKDFFIRMRLKI
jgi:hypothetical protein